MVAAHAMPPPPTSRDVLTKYERAKVIGMRMEQLARGAPPFVPDVPETATVRDIAMMELRAGRLPFVLQRTLPGGHTETRCLRDLVDLHPAER